MISRKPRHEQNGELKTPGQANENPAGPVKTASQKRVFGDWCSQRDQLQVRLITDFNVLSTAQLPQDSQTPP